MLGTGCARSSTSYAETGRAIVRRDVPDDSHRLVYENTDCRLLSVVPYLACDIRCVYCITGAQGTSRPRVGVEDVRAQLRRELDAMSSRQPRIGLGTVADAYPSVEADVGITRVVLDELIRLGWHVRIITKGTTIRRDIDLLLAGDTHVVVSVTTPDDDAIAHIEPGAPTPTARIEVVRELADAGVPVEVSASPWIPGVSDVTSLAECLGPSIAITVAPLNVNSPEVARTGYGRRFDQHEIDRAYLEEHERCGELASVRWLPPLTAQRPDNHHQVMLPIGTLRAVRQRKGTAVT